LTLTLAVKSAPNQRVTQPRRGRGLYRRAV